MFSDVRRNSIPLIPELGVRQISLSSRPLIYTVYLISKNPIQSRSNLYHFLLLLSQTITKAVLYRTKYSTI